MGLGLGEILAILAVVLLLFGPSRLPGLGKSVGEAIRGFKKGVSDDSIDVTESNKERIEENKSQKSYTAEKENEKNRS